MQRSTLLFASLLPLTALGGCFNPSDADDTDSGTEAGASTSTGASTTLDETTAGPGSPSTGTVDPSTTTNAGTSSSTTTPDESSTGRAEAVCGNGEVEEGETCDEGEANGDAPDACRSDCALPTCGDGIVDTDEECDTEATDCLRDCTHNTLEFGEFPDAVAVLGQPNAFSSEQNALGFAFRFPAGVFLHDGRAYMSNGPSRGVYIWDSIPTEGGVLPNGVLGRVAVQGGENPFGPSSIGIYPRGLSSNGERFAITDADGPRILLFDQVPAANTPADVVLGQPNFTTQGGDTTQDRFEGAGDVSIANDAVVVADPSANRVLVWNLIPNANGALPVVVLGQSNFNNGEPNRGADAPDADTLSQPSSVWTDGSRLAVADSGNNRILVWDDLPTENGQPADHVVGQADVTSGASGAGATGFNNPLDVMFVGNRFYVADQMNHRILLFTGWPTSNEQEADGVIGQASFDNIAPNDSDQDGVADELASPRTFSRPSALYVDGQHLIVADPFNHRGLIFEAVE